ncbi:Telomerase RNA component interacting RNase [Frankliniella fusca]|uniref:Telomerase RNA component interacting RNase n=1 Tax=Frankliniella fusca TaxID=407009 RepID=A0AAE1H1E9_9NEOP|nr:Telomerase RNA component interacting RNase [Frankliniella fusca]
MVYHRSEGDSTPPARDRAPPPSQSKSDAQPLNAFRNDGSFLEMFKRMQEASGSGTKSTSNSSKSSEFSPPPIAVKPESGPPAPFLLDSNPSTAGQSGNISSGDEGSKETVKRAPLVGKRRGGRVLPTGVVKKRRPGEEEPEEKPKDAWSLYMAEVKRYKETSCEEDGKTRPLKTLF